MHELSLAKSLIDQLVNLAQEHDSQRITKVTVLLGPFSGVVADSFDFGFNILKKDLPVTENAELILQTPPPEYKCLQCNTILQEENLNAKENLKYQPTERKTCRKCSSTNLSPQGGTELILQQLEME